MLSYFRLSTSVVNPWASVFLFEAQRHLFAHLFLLSSSNILEHSKMGPKLLKIYHPAVPGIVGNLHPFLIRRGPWAASTVSQVGGLHWKKEQAKLRPAESSCSSGSHLLSPSAGTSSSALLPTWAVYALPTLMLPQRFLSKALSSSSGPARNGPSLVSPTCPFCVPTRNHQSKSRDGKVVAGFSAYCPSCSGLPLLGRQPRDFEELGCGLSFQKSVCWGSH